MFILKDGGEGNPEVLMGGILEIVRGSSRQRTQGCTSVLAGIVVHIGNYGKFHVYFMANYWENHWIIMGTWFKSSKLVKLMSLPLHLGQLTPLVFAAFRSNPVNSPKKTVQCFPGPKTAKLP